RGGAFLVRTESDAIDATLGSEFGAMIAAAQAVPERRMRPLQRRDDDGHVAQMITAAVIVDAILRQALAQDVEGMVVVILRAREIDVIGFELRRRDAAPDADVEATAAEVVEHAQLLD